MLVGGQEVVDLRLVRDRGHRGSRRDEVAVVAGSHGEVDVLVLGDLVRHDDRIQDLLAVLTVELDPAVVPLHQCIIVVWSQPTMRRHSPVYHTHDDGQPHPWRHPQRFLHEGYPLGSRCREHTCSSCGGSACGGHRSVFPLNLDVLRLHLPLRNESGDAADQLRLRRNRISRHNLSPAQQSPIRRSLVAIHHPGEAQAATSRTISIASTGHSLAQTPHPLQ
ncbi:hypothetical protein ES703_55790 [subsurface metagenome]